MSTNVQLKIRTAGDWVAIHPKTNIEQLTDISIAGKAVAKLGNPETEGSFIAISTQGAASYRTPTQVRADLHASQIGHGHVIGDVTSLAATLATKADLYQGKLSSSQVPTWLLGGLRFKAAITGATATINQAFLTTHEIGTDPSSVGKYFIVTNTAGCSVTFDSALIAFTTGDESVTTGTIVLEQGDWIVFRKYETGIYQFDILNNNYQRASTTAIGIGRLSDGSITVRGALSSSSNSLKVMDEFAVRNVMKGIYYEDTPAAVTTPLIGDLLLEY